jgi:hypothetical protein
METDVDSVRDRNYTKEAVVLDGKTFVNCRFLNCELIYSGGRPFTFENSTADECTLSFVGRAENTVQTLAMMHRFGMQQFVEDMFEFIRSPRQPS